jgi:hypothetical protein
MYHTNNNDIFMNTLMVDDNFYIINDNNVSFINATHINNKYGSKNIIINSELKKKSLKFLITVKIKFSF